MVKKTQAKRQAKATISGRKHSRETMETRISQGQSETQVSLQDIADLIGSVEGLPPDLASNHKGYLKAWGYGRKWRHD
jgi:hypothetical protein